LDVPAGIFFCLSNRPQIAFFAVLKAIGIADMGNLASPVVAALYAALSAEGVAKFCSENLATSFAM
jgi:hypothetical protein